MPPGRQRWIAMVILAWPVFPSRLLPRTLWSAAVPRDGPIRARPGFRYPFRPSVPEATGSGPCGVGSVAVNSLASSRLLQREQCTSPSSISTTVGPPRWAMARAASSLAKGSPQWGQRRSLTRVLNGEISTSVGWKRTTIVPTGQIAAQAPHPMQSSEAMRNGAATARSTPRPTSEMAEAPIRSSHTRTHNPHKMQFRCDSVTFG